MLRVSHPYATRNSTQKHSKRQKLAECISLWCPRVQIDAGVALSFNKRGCNFGRSHISQSLVLHVSPMMWCKWTTRRERHHAGRCQTPYNSLFACDGSTIRRFHEYKPCATFRITALYLRTCYHWPCNNETWGPFYKHSLTDIRTWINNKPFFIWVVIGHPYHNFNLE